MATDSVYPPEPIRGVSVLVIHQGQVLLVKRGREPNRGFWALPGGRIEAGERAAEAAVREVAEETGIAIDGLREIDTVAVAGDRDSPGYALVVFTASYRSGLVMAGDDAADARWVALQDIAAMAITDGTRAIVAEHGTAAHA